MEYKIIVMKCSGVFGTDFQGTAEKLATAVREQIAHGWEPQGGVAIGHSAAAKTPHLFQALIKRR